MNQRNEWQYLIAVMVCIGFLGTRGQAQDAVALPGVGGPEGTQIVKLRTVWNVPKAHAGDKRVLAIVLDIQDGYHINPNQAQIPPMDDFFPVPTAVRVKDAPDALSFESVRFPKPHSVPVTYVEAGEIASFDGQTVLYLPVKIADDVEPGTQSFQIEVNYQACNDTNCLFPTSESLTVDVEIVEPGVAVGEANTKFFDEDVTRSLAATVADTSDSSVRFDLFGWSFSLDASTGLGVALLLLVAGFGGMLLNFTPCVLPVIPLKIMGLAKSSGNRAECFFLGFVMSLGVVTFWVALGGIIAASAHFATGGDGETGGITATNELFQYPAFTITVGVVIAAMAVGMCGLFAVRLPNWVYRINPKHDSIKGSFGFGIMTAVLSTPCTAPFMGAAAAWAATQPWWMTLMTFGAIGIGMGLPYLVLAAFPKLVDKMPRTGPASELLKQVMGLLMLSAALYFIGVGISVILVEAPDPPSLAYWWPVMGMIGAAGAWLVIRLLIIKASLLSRAVFLPLALLMIAGAAWGGVHLTDRGPIDWIYYTEKRFDEAIAEGNVVVMDFTAEWCLNCKALEHSVLYSNRVVKLFDSPGVIPMKVDITGRNPEGKKRLKDAGRLTIPLLVVYAPDGAEKFKSDFYTVNQVIDAVKRAQSGRVAAVRKPDQD